MLRFSSLMATAIAVPVVSLFGTTTASADVILQEF